MFIILDVAIVNATKFVKGNFRYFFNAVSIEKQGLAMRLGKGGGVAAALLRNQLIFWSSHPSRRHFSAQFRQTSPVRLFDEVQSLDVFIPGIFRVSIEVIIPKSNASSTGRFEKSLFQEVMLAPSKNWFFQNSVVVNVSYHAILTGQKKIMCHTL